MKSKKVGRCGADVVLAERYSPERKAEFLLNNAVEDADYCNMREEIRKMALRI
jgi:hypothetical protein